MDKAVPPEHRGPPATAYPAPRKDDLLKEDTLSRESWDSDKEKCASGGRKKNYQRYPKPPYSYLAMIAMVIQNSPEKKLTLSEVKWIYFYLTMFDWITLKVR